MIYVKQKNSEIKWVRIILRIHSVVLVAQDVIITSHTDSSASDLIRRIQTPVKIAVCRAHVAALHRTYTLSHNIHTTLHISSVCIPRRVLIRHGGTCIPLAQSAVLRSCLMIIRLGGARKNCWVLWTECTYIVHLHTWVTVYTHTHWFVQSLFQQLATKSYYTACNVDI